MTAAKTVGIIGGGQLARMMTEAAHSLDVRVLVLEPNHNSPASQVGAEQVFGTYFDNEKILEFAQRCDAITIDLEHVGVDALSAVQSMGTRVVPTPESVSIIQNKYIQKLHLKRNDIPVAPFFEIKAISENLNEIEGDAIVVKSKLGGFDGRGNFVFNNVSESFEDVEAFSNEEYYFEQKVDFTKEISVIGVVSDAETKIKFFPIFETQQKDNICETVFAPADISIETAQSAISIAGKTIQSFKSSGTFAIEMFVLPSGEVLVNEVAPRVHNSGHLTLGGCNVSQFEQHIRAVLGIELIDPELVADFVYMINILGDRQGPAKVTQNSDLEELSHPNVNIQVYGKEEVRPQRKVGHITCWGNSSDEVIQLANEMYKKVNI